MQVGKHLKPRRRWKKGQKIRLPPSSRAAGLWWARKAETWPKVENEHSTFNSDLCREQAFNIESERSGKPARQFLGDSAKQIAVGARAFKPDMAAVFHERVDQNPVRFNPSSPRPAGLCRAGIQHSTFNIE
jgi:hypothetical protein